MLFCNGIASYTYKHTVYTYAAPSGPARNIRVERISTTAVEVTWEDPAPEHINAVGGITGYEVVIGSGECRGESKKPRNTTNLKVVFDGLDPGNRYCVRVFPLNSIGAAPNGIVRNSAVTVELPDVLRKFAWVLHHRSAGILTLCVNQLHKYVCVFCSST